MSYFDKSSKYPHGRADPAAEEFAYPVSVDVRELVTLEDVMEEMQLGPNGCGPLGIQNLAFLAESLGNP